MFYSGKNIIKTSLVQTINNYELKPTLTNYFCSILALNVLNKSKANVYVFI